MGVVRVVVDQHPMKSYGTMDGEPRMENLPVHKGIKEMEVGQRRMYGMQLLKKMVGK